MSTIKISELALISQLNANTSNTLFVAVDLPSGITGKFTGHTLAQGLYSNEILNVGGNPVALDNISAQFSGSDPAFLQINNQNISGNGSSDYIATANVGTNETNYIDMGINGSTFSDPVFSSMSALDGYLYAHGTSHSSSDGNLIIGTASKGANIVFIAGGTTSGNIVGTINKSSFNFGKDTYVTGNVNVSGAYVFTDSSRQTSAAAPLGYTQASFDKANTASSNTVYLAGALNQTNTNITSANTQLKAYTDGAIASANTQLKSYTDGKFLSNTNGNTFAGTLNISDKLIVNGSVIFANTRFTAMESALTIAACPIHQVQTPSNDGYMLHISGKQDVPSRIVFDSFGANTYGVVAGRTSRGTPTSPLPTANGDVLMRITGNGWGTTGYAPLGIARLDIVATENYTDAHRGSRIEMWNMPNGSNTLNRIAEFNGDSVIFTGVVNPQKGFIYNSNVVSGITNSLTIDIANNSLYKFDCNSTTSISLSGYQHGKVVEVWLKNVDNNNHTVTHGCQANNSTVGSATFSLTSGHSAYLRYFSIDGDIANTYVSINYS
jgi:hypothetical protein